jgi:chromosome segregation ATPase
MCEEIDNAVEHCRERLDVYDQGADCVRVKRKFLEQLLRYIRVERRKPAAVQSLVNDFRKKLIERDETIEALETTNATLHSNLKFRDEQLNKAISFNWQKIAEDNQARAAALEKELSEAKKAHTHSCCEITRLEKRIFEIAKNLAATQRQRDNLKKRLFGDECRNIVLSSANSRRV